MKGRTYYVFVRLDEPIYGIFIRLQKRYKVVALVNVLLFGESKRIVDL